MTTDVDKEIAKVRAGKGILGRCYQYGSYWIMRWDNAGLVTIQLSPEAKAEGKVISEALIRSRWVDLNSAISAIDRADPIAGKRHAAGTETIYDSRAGYFTNENYFGQARQAKDRNKK